MKRVVQCLIFVIGTFAVAILSVSAQSPTEATRPAFKGWELYSFTLNGEWKFNLLLGTNRNKTSQEILNPSDAMDLKGLKERLATLAVGDSVFWFNTGTGSLAYPPAAVVNDLKTFAAQKQLKFYTREE